MTCHRLSLILSLALAPLTCGTAAHANPDGVAVIIGNRHYQGAVPEVSYAHRDAEAFKRYVLDALRYDPANLIDLRDATQAEMVATFGNEKSAEGNLWAYLDPAGGSDVVVFYSGHGVPGQRDGKGYLLPADADPNVPELNAYPIELLYANLSKLAEAGSVAVFLDACFSGGSQRGMLIENASPVYVSAALPTAVGSVMTVLTAASAGQLASWDTTAGHGMFTHHLLDALYGKGDADGDGRVSAAEAKRYLDRHMTRAARRAYKRNQVASLLGDGEMALAFSGGAGFVPRPTLGPGGVSAADIDEMDGVRWAKQGVNLRAGPSTEHPVARSLAAGEEVTLKGRVRDSDWLLVATSEGGEAFVYAPLLDDQRPSASVPPTPAPVRDTALEATFWESVKDGGAAGFKAYLQQYPDGAFAPLALARLREWAPIENSTEPGVFEEYLASNPNGHFAGLARTALQQRIGRSDKETLDRYLARYPNGSAADMARERLPVAAWAIIKESNEFGVFLEYLQRYPGSAHEAEARQRLGVTIDESTDVDALNRLAHEQPGSPFAQHAQRRASKLEWLTIADSPRFVAWAETQFAMSGKKDGIWVGRDCTKCPQMVVVPAGSYRMGAADGFANERPVHEVTIGAPFAVGKHEVTFVQWDACVRDLGCPRGNDGDRGWGRGQRPVINVSWDDAQRFLRWLSEKTKKPYRLLSESEWEYAARAGTETAYSLGDDIGFGRANCDGCGSRWDSRQTAPVGSFAPNVWGLFDMHGNVWEWVEDCWNDSYAGSPRDGSALAEKNCSERVLRGGSWNNEPGNLRSAMRVRDSTADRSGNVGFRVARTLTPRVLNLSID